MANSSIGDGNTVTVVAPAGGLTAGQGYLIDGTRFGRVLNTVLEGGSATVFIGRHSAWYPKVAATAFTKGEPAFWDDGNSEMDNATTVGHVLVGTVAADALAGDTHAEIIVDGVHRIAE